jgi:alkanesulfonate monooxygenase
MFFINGRPLPDTAAAIDDLRSRPRDRGPLRFGSSAFVIARETEAEASMPKEISGRRSALTSDCR